MDLSTKERLCFLEVFGLSEIEKSKSSLNL